MGSQSTPEAQRRPWRGQGGPLRGGHGPSHPSGDQPGESGYFFSAADQCPLEAPDSQTNRALVGYVAPGSSVPWVYAVECYRRGEHQFGPVRLECSAPFGLFRARRSVSAPLRLLVYPQVFDFAVARLRGELREGPTVPTPAQRIGEFRGAREYQPGDSLRQVHWKSSARSGQLTVKEYDRGPESQTVLFLNAGHNAGTGKESTLEYGIKLAASIARACYGSDSSFRMAPPGLGVQFPHWRAALEYLTRLADGEGAPPDRGLASLARAGRVIAIVAATDGEGLKAVRRLPADRLAAVILLRRRCGDARAQPAGQLLAGVHAGRLRRPRMGQRHQCGPPGGGPVGKTDVFGGAVGHAAGPGIRTVLFPEGAPAQRPVHCLQPRLDRPGGRRLHGSSAASHRGTWSTSASWDSYRVLSPVPRLSPVSLRGDVVDTSDGAFLTQPRVARTGQAADRADHRGGRYRLR